MRLKDRVAIVTGGGRGIGRAISLAFASEGAIVVAAARTISKLNEVVEEIKSKGRKAKAIQTNVSDEKEVQQLVSQTLDEYGRIDILVNNSGVSGPTANMFELNLNEWKEVLDTNLTGIMLCAKEVLKSMIPRRSGNIINIGSESGRAGHPMRSPYSVSKWGVIGLTETLSIEVGQFNIRVNCISPGAVRGERLVNVVRAKADAMGISFDEQINRVASKSALKRIVEPSEVAAAAVFLASDESSGITGHNLVVNCGLHLIS